MTQATSILSEAERESQRRFDHIAGLRQMATFLEHHPDLPLPFAGSHNAFVDSREAIAVIAREPGVNWLKGYLDHSYFVLSVTFAGGHSYEVNIERSKVCRKVVLGTRIVPAEPEKEVEDVRWECDEPLLAGAHV